MPINANCLKKLTAIGLPMKVDVINDNQQVVANAIINSDGTVCCSNGLNGVNNKTYGSPSLLRHELIGPNKPTYCYLWSIKHMQTLRDMGVSP